MKFYGKYKGICRDHHDPWMVGRIRAEVPYPLGTGEGNWSVWALPCLPPGHADVPEEGDGVWVEFEQGDPNRPIWVGVYYRGKGATTAMPFQATHPALTDMEGEVVDPDKLVHAQEGTVDHDEHREWHDHADSFYTPHRRGLVSGLGANLEFNDHPGVEGRVRLTDRFGRALEFLAKGLARLRSTPDPAAPTKVNKLVLADTFNAGQGGEEAGQYILLKDMGDQHVRLHASEGEEYVEVLDKAGQTIRLDVATGTVQVQDANGNSIVMEDGTVRINLAAGASLLVNGEALATESHVDNVFKNHVHPSSTGPTGKPVPMGIENQWPQVTKNRT